MNKNLKSNLILIGLAVLFGILIYALFDNNTRKTEIKQLKETVQQNQKLINSQDSILNAFSIMNLEYQKNNKHLIDTIQSISKNYNAKVNWFNKQNSISLKVLNDKIDSLKLQYPNIPIIDK